MKFTQESMIHDMVTLVKQFYAVDVVVDVDRFAKDY